MPSIRSPSIRSLLMTTTPNAPYAAEPTRAELLAAMKEILRLGATGTHSVWDVPRAILKREDTYRAWQARADALQVATLSHYKQGRACQCKSCERWREERRNLYADKAAAHGLP